MAPHIYVEADIPDGMTCAEWRKVRGTPRRRGWLARLLGR